MTVFSRAAWGARPSRGGPGDLDPARVVGLAFHWPAMTRPLTTVAAVKAALRGWQDYHMDGQGWSDIAYQVAVDQAGNEYTLRGLGTISGANGDSTVNRTHGSLLLILAPGETPTRAMIRTVRRVVKRHRALFPNSTQLVGHTDIRPEPTACPGPAVDAALDAGVFEPRVWTRGPRIDAVLAELRTALTGATGARRTTLERARDALRSLPRWRKRS